MRPSSSHFRKPPNSSRAGFTLIEVLAALFIAGLAVMIVLPLLVQLVAKAWSGEANLASADEWMQASARLTADFSEAVPISLEIGKSDLAFKATPHRITFVRRSLGAGQNGLETVTVAIESDADGEVLLRSVQPYSKDAFGDGTDEPQGARVAVLKTKYQLRFEVSKAGTEPRSTGEPRQLPHAVTLYVDSGDALPDIPFVFPIVARTNPSAAAPPKDQ